MSLNLTSLPVRNEATAIQNSFFALRNPSQANWSQWMEQDTIWRRAILSAANSDFIGSGYLFRRIDELEKEVSSSYVSMLGLAAALAPSFSQDRQIENYNRRCLWRHSIATAVVAESIARITACCSPIKAFTAGICHDIGWLELERYQETRLHYWLLLAREGGAVPEQEVSHLPQSHADAGAEYLESLEAPMWIVETARLHHRSHLSNTENRNVVHCVSMANFLVSRQGWTSIGTNNALAPSGLILRELDIDTGTLKMLWAQLSMFLDEAGSLANRLLTEARR
jgi:putative nucleotidyltransferase with HDIG domain